MAYIVENGSVINRETIDIDNTVSSISIKEQIEYNKILIEQLMQSIAKLEKDYEEVKKLEDENGIKLQEESSKRVK
jgi:hypothetical protein